MLLRILATFLMISILYGCVPVYIASNPLSEKYIESGDFFDKNLAKLKTDDVLLYLWGGYYRKAEDGLILSIQFDSLDNEIILLKEVNLVSNGQVVVGSHSDKLYAEGETNLKNSTIYRFGTQIAFDVQDISQLLGTNLSLAVTFYYKGIERSKHLDLIIERKLVWPT